MIAAEHLINLPQFRQCRLHRAVDLITFTYLFCDYSMTERGPNKQPFSRFEKVRHCQYHLE
jgi:hypothetical protein